MKRILASLAVMMVLGGVGAASLAQSSPIPTPTPPGSTIVPDQDVNSLIGNIFTDLAAGKVTMAIAGIVVLCTFLFRKYFVDTGKLGAGSLPWVSVVLAAAFGIASNVFLGASPAAAASAILLSGPLASHIWSSIIKLVVAKA